MTCEHGNCNCSQAEVEALICELFDDCLDPARARAIRLRLSECAACDERLRDEEFIRQHVKKCCSNQPAPPTLRERITVQIRMTRRTYR
ncbi:Hypothetical Protein NG00_00584 [Corynebacterium camporealensis]|uniref:Uncharacterized protein n=1 Tax=Corynebacterium camporealensis TaxID=161896 RepID=A0A0F6QXD7_9CORY|nr:hypothetical protein [Corynebacterium camporealensis]AKE38623.1 hypothetical protein UL81_03210 [Corynebacterium camporealensis]AVH87912.1 Hypothetical Protein NG00_00584 [Corynebacterium camporealensis]